MKVLKLALVAAVLAGCYDEQVVAPEAEQAGKVAGPSIVGPAEAPVLRAAVGQPAVIGREAAGPSAPAVSMLAAAAVPSMQHLLWHNSSAGNLGFWPMSGTTYTGGWNGLGSVPGEWEVAALADFNADGKSDLVWQNTVTGVRGVWILDGPAFAGDWRSLGIVATEWDIAAAADMNMDGKADLLWQNTVTGVRVIWIMDGATFTGTSYTLGQVATAWEIDAAGDFDGDFDSDIVWHNTANGSRGIWPMQGPNYVGGWYGIGIVPAEWKLAAVADYTDDGKLDLIWSNTTTGVRGVWPMNGATYTGGWHLIEIVPVEWRLSGLLRPGPSITINPRADTLHVGETGLFAYDVRDSRGNTPNVLLTLGLSNGAAAEFANNGVRGKAPGSTWLIASANVLGVYVRDSIPVTVVP